MSQHGVYQREPSISSERTLDNLEAIQSASSSPLNSPPGYIATGKSDKVYTN